MVTWLEPFGIAVLWLVAFLRVPRSVRHRRQRGITGVCFAIALTMTIYRQPVLDLLMAVIPSGRAIDLVRHALSISAGAFVLHVILAATGRARHLGPLVGTTALVVAVLLALDATAPAHTRSGITTPQMPMAYWVLFFGFKLVANTLCAYLCWRRQAEAEDRSVRTGLAVFTLGMLSCDVLWVVHLVYAAVRDPDLLPLISPLMGVQALLVAVAAGLPLVAGVRRFLDDHRAHRRLRPLWLSLVTALPHVRADSPHSRLSTFVSPRAMSLVLYRVLIEVRDAILALRDHVPADVGQRVVERVDGLDVPDADRDAFVMALWLDAALEARRQGHGAREGHSTVSSLGGASPEEELDFLLRVAEARDSPLTAATRPPAPEPRP
ncbi:RacC protein [Actinokineospora spheciospongiae]|uniref:RacC protein n=1 Tax=Actinokineospora spheciospongiae TaxID=909613 RepID=W7IYP8_9PSEU|nr:MAB_1171c family putative transporter [Actinokineospora spheciospongiae]EWC59154.1 RacC protein [Actinokineospora spheciospongiae]